MSQAENLYFPDLQVDVLNLLFDALLREKEIDLENVNQVIMSLFSINQNDVKIYQDTFLSFLNSTQEIPQSVLASTESLSLICVGLLSLNLKTQCEPFPDYFFDSCEIFLETKIINPEDLMKFCVIFYKSISIMSFTKVHKKFFVSLFIHFLEIDCISNEFSVCIISNLLNCVDSLLHVLNKNNKTDQIDLKSRSLAVCHHYTLMKANPMKMIMAANFILKNSNKTDESLQTIISALNSFHEFHEDSLYNAFYSISNNFSVKLKEVGFSLLQDAFTAVTKFKQINSKKSLIFESQINAILALNFFGVEKRIEIEMDYFNSAINLLVKENSDISLNQLCESFRFSPVLSFRNYQVHILFCVYSVLIENNILFLLENKQNSAYSISNESELLKMMQSFGRNIVYFQTLVETLFFFNKDISNGLFITVSELGRPIMSQFINIMKDAFMVNFLYIAHHEYPTETFFGYDSDYEALLDQLSDRCIQITKQRNIWEIMKFTFIKIFDIINIFPNNIISLIFKEYVKIMFGNSSNDSRYKMSERNKSSSVKSKSSDDQIKEKEKYKNESKGGEEEEEEEEETINETRNDDFTKEENEANDNKFESRNKLNLQKIYPFIINTFSQKMNNLLIFFYEIYDSCLKEIDDPNFIVNVATFFSCTNKWLKNEHRKCLYSKIFVFKTRTFFIEFFQHTFSKTSDTYRYSSVLTYLFRIIRKIFDSSILLSIVPEATIIDLYFAVPSVNKEIAQLNKFLIELYPTHKSLFNNHEWYRLLFLKNAILKPHITIPVLQNIEIFAEYLKTEEYKKFANDLFTIFDSTNDFELKKEVLNLINVTPIKYTASRQPKITDISRFYFHTFPNRKNNKGTMLDSQELLEFIVELVSQTDTDNLFDPYIPERNVPLNAPDLTDVYKFSIQIANSVIVNCETRDNYLFIHTIFSVLIENGIQNICELCSMTRSIAAHFLVALTVYQKKNINFSINDNTNDCFSEILKTAEKIIFQISVPNYRVPLRLCFYLIDIFSQKSINIVELTEFFVNHVLRHLKDEIILSTSKENNVLFKINNHLPEEVLEFVMFLKNNASGLNVCDFMNLFYVKMPTFASFALCEIIANCNADDNIIIHLDALSKIDLVQLVPLLCTFPHYQEKYKILFSKVLDKLFHNTPKNPNFPAMFLLLDFDIDYYNKFVGILIDKFNSCLDQSEIILIADILNKILNLAGKDEQINNIVANKLWNEKFNEKFFVSSFRGNIAFMVPLFIINPTIVLDVIFTQLNYLVDRKYQKTTYIQYNFRALVRFLVQRNVLNFLCNENDKTNYYFQFGKTLIQIYYAFTFDIAELMVHYFRVAPKIWVEFLTQNISKDEFTFFFFENRHSEGISDIVDQLVSETEILEKNIQKEFVEFFAFENALIPIKLIRDNFISLYTQIDRRYVKSMLKILITKGDIWEIIIEIIKSQKEYLILILKLELSKLDNVDLVSLPSFIPKIPHEQIIPFFQFFFENFKEYISYTLLASIFNNFSTEAIYTIHRIATKYGFDCELNVARKIENGSEYDHIIKVLFYADNDNNNNGRFIEDILDSLDIDSPHSLFKLIEDKKLYNYYPNIPFLLQKFVNHPKHFCSILKFIETNRTEHYPNPFELFSTQFIMFTFLNLINNDSGSNYFFNNGTEICDIVDCFNALCLFLPVPNEVVTVHLYWGKKLSEAASFILPRFVQDNEYFHTNYSTFNRNLLALAALFGYQCHFVKTYIDLISQYFKSGNLLIVQELMETVPELLRYLNEFEEIILIQFPTLLESIINSPSFYLAFPYVIFSLNILNENSIRSTNEISQHFSYLLAENISFGFDVLPKIEDDSPFSAAFKNILFRLFVNKENKKNISEIINEINTNGDNRTLWLIFAAIQQKKLIRNELFSNNDLNSLFFQSMPFSLVKANIKRVKDPSKIPLYYYKHLTDFTFAKKCWQDNNLILDDYSLNQYIPHIMSNVASRNVPLNLIENDCVGFVQGLKSCLFDPNVSCSFGNKSHLPESNGSSSVFIQEVMSIIGISKNYPNQIIERINRAVAVRFKNMDSKDVIQYLCVSKMTKNPIIPPYFTRYHPLKLFQDFNNILEFATTKGLDVDFEPMKKSEPFILQANYNIKDEIVLTELTTKRDFLLYALKSGFEDNGIWANIQAIENDDLLYLYLHSGVLPAVAQKEVLKQVFAFPFRWCSILYDDIRKNKIKDAYLPLVRDSFRQDFRSIFSNVTKLDSIQKLRERSISEQEILNEENVKNEELNFSHNFVLHVKPIDKYFCVLPSYAPLVDNENPMYCMYVSLEKENASYATLDVCLIDGRRINYIISGFANSSLELPILAHILTKIMQKRVKCRNGHIELRCPQSVEIDTNLFLVRTDAKPLLKESIYPQLKNAIRFGIYPEIKSNDMLIPNFMGQREFIDWETTFIRRFSALSYFQVGLKVQVPLPFHLLIDEKSASVELVRIRDLIHMTVGENHEGKRSEERIRIFGEMRHYISPVFAKKVMPRAVKNIACAFKFADDRIYKVLELLMGKIEYAENMKEFNEAILKDKKDEIIGNLIESSWSNVPIYDIPWY